MQASRPGIVLAADWLLERQAAAMGGPVDQ
jgi:hypothetical protein